MLNLFDIVRLYETRDGKNNRSGKTTISEAQLIGRGARYYPFKLNDADDKFKRKYDKNLEDELRILEELHYHSHNESRYISEIKTALIEEGMMDEDEVEVELKLKEEFKKSNFFKSGLVYANEKKKRSFEKVKELADLGVSKKILVFNLYSGTGVETQVFENPADASSFVKTSADKETMAGRKDSGREDRKDISLKTIEPHIIKNALARNDFYSFNSLKHYFPEIESVNDFISKTNYLSGLSITFEGGKDEINNLRNENKFLAVLSLLSKIEAEIKSNLTEYEGTQEFIPALINKKIGDKKIKIKKDSERFRGQAEFLEDKEWYVFYANYGTREEKAFVELIDRQIDELSQNFKEIYLLRNERQLKIYDFKGGRSFEPDYLLFLIDKSVS